MKTLVLYRPNSEYARSVEEFVHEFKARSDGDKVLEVFNLDSRDGARFAELYGIVQYPAILVLQGDGFMQKSWEGGVLPLVDEVLGYTRA